MQPASVEITSENVENLNLLKNLRVEVSNWRTSALEKSDNCGIPKYKVNKTETGGEI